MFVRLHRWVGLSIAGFLGVAGATGSLIAFEDDIEAWLVPELFVVAPPHIGAPLLDPFLLRELAQQAVPQAAVVSVDLAPRPLRSIVYRLEPRSDLFPEFTANQAFVDPYSGRVLGVRTWGESLWQRETFLTFLYKLHFSLALPAPYGRLSMGVIAVLWTLDTFVGFYLTLPRARPLLLKWLPAWRIKPTRLAFDLHRTLGLWLWLMLLVFAWSSVSFNLGDEVYRPVMGKFFRFEESRAELMERTATNAPLLAWREAYVRARQAMEDLAQRRGFDVIAESEMRYVAALGIYSYSVRSSLDPAGAGTAVFIDAENGGLLGSELPTGVAAGNTVTTWLQLLHTGHVFGWPYRILVSVVGAATAVLSVTGTIIWWRKRRGRISAHS